MQADLEKRPVDGFPAKHVWRNGHGTTQGTEEAPEIERAPSPGRLGSDIGQIDPVESRSGKLLSPSQRRVCRVLGQHRSTQRRVPQGRADEERLVADMIELTRQYGRYGYRRVAALLRDAGWQVNDQRVERLWRREGLKVPMKQPKKGRLWMNDGSCVRLRPECRNHVWSYDFLHHRTDDGRAFRTLNILDEHSRECLAIRVKRKLNSAEVIDALTDLFILRGVPAYIRSDNQCPAGDLVQPNLPRGALSSLLRPSETGSRRLGQGLPTSNPGHPGRTDIVSASTGECGPLGDASITCRLIDELLNGEIFYSLREAQIIIERWRDHYNTKRPHSAGLPPTCARGHRSDGPKANHACMDAPLCARRF